MHFEVASTLFNKLFVAVAFIASNLLIGIYYSYEEFLYEFAIIGLAPAKGEGLRKLLSKGTISFNKN